MAQKRTALDHAALGTGNGRRRRIARHGFFPRCAGWSLGIAANGIRINPLGESIGPVEVRTPVPDISAHVVETVAIRRKGSRRRGTNKTVLAIVLGITGLATQGFAQAPKKAVKPAVTQKKAPAPLAKPAPTVAVLKNQKDSLSAAIGVSFSNSLTSQGINDINSVYGIMPMDGVNCEGIWLCQIPW